MTREEAIKRFETLLLHVDTDCVMGMETTEAINMAISALKAQIDKDTNVPSNDVISRQEAIKQAKELFDMGGCYCDEFAIIGMLNSLPSAQPNLGKYEYHYDHTDCIWYRPEARNRCPVTCAQYRDGWNDAMNYIFRDGKGYMPYRRDKQYGE